MGVAQPPKENGGTVTVKLGPGAAGRAAWSGRPGPPWAAPDWSCRSGPRGGAAGTTTGRAASTTDRDGRFRVGGLLPGHEFRLSGEPGEVQFGTGLESGRTTDVGDVRLQRSPE